MLLSYGMLRWLVGSILNESYSYYRNKRVWHLLAGARTSVAAPATRQFLPCIDLEIANRFLGNTTMLIEVD